MTSQQLASAWRRFLVDTDLARHYRLAAASVLGPAPTNPLLEQLLPSLLTLRAGSLLDDGLQVLMRSQGLRLPRSGYRKSLKGRIEFLSAEGVITNRAKLHDIRERRNAIGHEVTGVSTWEQLTADTDEIHATLHPFGLLPARPIFALAVEREPVEPSPIPGALLSFRHTFRLKEGDHIAAEIAWLQHVMAESD